jgi:hypothetical protein
MTTRHSSSGKENPGVADWTDARPELREASNLDFVAAALQDLYGSSGPVGRGAVCLVGLRDLPGVILRRAQAILRWDLRPSLWSHAFLIGDDVEPTPEAVERAPIFEVALHSRAGEFPDPAYNAITTATLGHYKDSDAVANFAVIRVEMNPDEVEAVTARATDPNCANLDRLRYDLWQTLGVWQSYFWSAGAAENPLRQSVSLFSSAFVEYCYEAIQLDLAPAASDRNGAPEHLWNAAKWWHKELAHLGHPISGRCVLRDQHCTLLDPPPRAAPG